MTDPDTRLRRAEILVEEAEWLVGDVAAELKSSNEVASQRLLRLSRRLGRETSVIQEVSSAL